MTNIDLTSKAALALGATRRIRFSITREFLSSGANLILTGTKEASKETLSKKLKPFSDHYEIRPFV